MFPATFSLTNLDGTNGFIITGSAASDYSGHSVSAAGDINGDGIADLIIGAPQNAGPNLGKCFVVFGGVGVGSNGMLALTNLNGTNGFVITGEANDNIGSAVSSAGDFNGDGKDDLILGTYSANSYTGKSYLVFGASNIGINGTLSLYSLTGTNGFVLTGEVAGDKSGYSVSFAGDINHDGKNDVLIGAYGAEFTYVVFGGPNVGSSGTLALSSLTGTNGFVIVGEGGGGSTGFSVSDAGDINEDGNDDLIIGAWAASPGGFTNAGKSYVIFGGVSVGNSGTLMLSSLSGTNGFILTGEIAGDYSGWSVSGLGDLNGDGKDDVIIGAPQGGIVSSTGKSYVVFGGSGVGSGGTLALSSLTGTNGFKIAGEAAGDLCGYSVASAGDINNDGKVDVVIGAHNANSYTGKSYVVFGNVGVGGGTLALSSLNGANGFKLTGQRFNDQSGYSVSGAGDINNDGKSDLIVGAPYATAGVGANAGKSYVIFGGGFSPSSSPSITPSVTLSTSISPSTTVSPSFSATRSTSYSRSLSLSVSPSFSSTGSVSKSITTTPTLSVTSGLTPTQSPSQSSSPSPTLSITRTPTSSIAPFPATFNLASLDGTNGFKIIGETPYDLTGYSVSSAGDVNGDGKMDILIGAPNYLTPGADKSYVVFGGPNVGRNGTVLLSNLNGNNGFKIVGTGAAEHSGISVSAAGDINVDGKADLIIGAPHTPIAFVSNSAAPDIGRSYVVFGNTNIGGNGTLILSSLNGSNGFALLGEAVGDLSGWAVNSAGDINNDGKADLIVGAHGINSYTGRSYVVFGGMDIGTAGTLALSSLNGVNGFKIIGEAAQSYTGNSVSGGGDINGDGKADLIIGAAGANLYGGTTYVLFGGASVGSGGTFALSSLNGTNGFKIIGEAPGDNSGASVKFAGDINNDGKNDLIIGAWAANSGTGKSYVVFGGSGVGSSGVIPLSSLTGSNGFKLLGEFLDDTSGFSVSSIADMNGDNISDLLIGAPDAYINSGTGKSYIVFGGAGVGSSGTLALANLNGNNGFKIVGETPNDKCGWSMSSAGDINGDGKVDLLIGAPYANLLAGKTYVVFGGGFPVSSSPSASPTTSLTSSATTSSSASSSVSATNSGSASTTTSSSPSTSATASISSSASTTSSAAISLTPTSSISITSSISPSYSATATSTTSLSDSPTTSSSATISLTNSLSNSHTLTPTSSMTLSSSATATTSTSLSASSTASSSSTISLTNSVSNSHTLTPTSSITLSSSESITPTISLTSTTSPTISVTSTSSLSTSLSSSQTQTPSNSVTTGLTPTQTPSLSFSSSITPSISFTSSITPSSSTTPSLSATPYPAPTLISNFLTIGQGQTVIMTPANIGIGASQVSAANILVTVSNIQHGQFERSSIPGIAITTFSDQELMDGLIRFIHDGTPYSPSYDVQVSAATYLPPAQPARIIFNHMPVLVTNTLTINPGETVVLTAANLNATDVETPSAFLNFIVSNVASGYFTDTSKPNARVTTFKQGQMLNGSISFTAANSFAVPQYAVSVSDGVLTTAPPEFAAVIYNPVVNTVSTTSQQTIEDIIRKALISFSVTGSLGLVLFLLKIYLGRKLNSTVDKRLNEKTNQRNDALKNVLKPIAKKVFEHIKISGFLGCISEQRVNAYIDAIEILLERLQEQHINEQVLVNLNLSALPATERQRYQTQLNHLIAIQIRRILVPPRSCCSTASCLRFFRADVAPQVFEDAIPRMVPAILEALQNAPELIAAMQRVGVTNELEPEQAFLSDVPAADYDVDTEGVEMFGLRGQDEAAGVTHRRLSTSVVNRRGFFGASAGLALEEEVVKLRQDTARMAEELAEIKQQRLLSPAESQADFVAQGFGA